MEMGKSERRPVGIYKMGDGIVLEKVKREKDLCRICWAISAARHHPSPCKTQLAPSINKDRKHILCLTPPLLYGAVIAYGSMHLPWLDVILVCQLIPQGPAVGDPRHPRPWDKHISCSWRRPKSSQPLQRQVAVRPIHHSSAPRSSAPEKSTAAFRSWRCSVEYWLALNGFAPAGAVLLIRLLCSLQRSLDARYSTQQWEVLPIPEILDAVGRMTLQATNQAD
ncbi:hypothetical protein E2C01_059019 [Portunus trituberculatus]|uniref:Uncharacterized protein n=1 Tax=Portunus trituberculatus TaxID=210409 RepID=A0A5B7H4P8_PORTR|nr:hypothetical protein [Portunus trituberculatus]